MHLNGTNFFLFLLQIFFMNRALCNTWYRIVRNGIELSVKVRNGTMASPLMDNVIFMSEMYL